jgi:Flp pilus assembly protein TadG
MSTGKLKTLYAKFQRDEKGNFLMIFAFATAVIFLSAGLAVEYSQAINIKTRVTNALDAATLATARAISIGDITEAEGEQYLKDVFMANIGIDALDGSRYTIQNIVINSVSQTVSAQATYNQDLDFISVGKAAQSQDVSSMSAATYGQSDIEVAMVLDTTGSMGGSKIQALRDAATLGVEELLSINTPGDEKVRISLVPYAYAVNAGPLAKYIYPDFEYAMSNAPKFNAEQYASTGTGYIMESFVAANQDLVDGGYDFDDDPGDDCGTDRKRPLSGTNYQISDANPWYGMIPRDPRLPSSGCPSAALMPLTSDETALKNRIAELPASGYTAGHIGLQWAYYTISHDWASYMPSGSEPGDHTNPDNQINKYIILMTDGEFNTAYADVYKFGGDWKAGNQGTKSTAFTGNMCTDVKNHNIKIFTIGFQLTNSTAITMLKACATPNQGDVTFHYEPETAEELKETYEQIANTIQSLLLIQ